MMAKIFKCQNLPTRVVDPAKYNRDHVLCVLERLPQRPGLVVLAEVSLQHQDEVVSPPVQGD